MEKVIPKLDISSAISPIELHLRRNGVLWNFLFLVIASLVEAFCGLVSGIYARRVLGVSTIGQVTWAAAFVSYLALLVNPGLDIIARRESSRDMSQTSYYLVWLILLQMALASLGFGLALIISQFIPRPDSVRWLIILYALGLFLIPLDIRWTLQAAERVSPLACASIIASIFQTVLLITIVHEPSHVYRYVLLAFPFRLAVYSFVLVYATRSRIITWRRIPMKTNDGKKILLTALPIGLSGLAILLYNNFDAIVLGFTDGDKAVGLYRTAYSLMLVPIPLLEILNIVSLPTLSRAINDVEKAKETSTNYMKFLTWSGFILGSLGWTVGRHLVTLLFGPTYSLAGPIFEWLSINIALIFFNFSYNSPLIAWNKQSEAARNNFWGSITNISTNLILIPFLGIPGAIITTILAEMAVMAGVIRTRKRSYPADWIRIFLPALFIGLSAALISRLLTMYTSWYFGIVVCLFINGAGFMFFERRLVARLFKYCREFQQKRADVFRR